MCILFSKQIHYSATYATLLPFAVLDYDPPTTEEFFDVCVQHFTPYISTIFPHFNKHKHLVYKCIKLISDSHRFIRSTSAGSSGLCFGHG